MNSRYRWWATSLFAISLILAACSSDDTPDTAVPGDVDAGRALIEGDDDKGEDASDEASSEESVATSDGTDTPSTTTQAPDPEPTPPTTDTFADQATPDPDAEGEQPEPGSETPDIEEIIEEITIDAPCDLYEDNDLGASMSDWSASANVFAELPSGLGANTSIEFTEASASSNSCEWFSDSHVWFVGVTWDVADPTFLESFSQRFDDNAEARQFQVGVMDGFVLDDSTAQLVGRGLLVSISNLVPGSQGVTGDIDVTEALARDIAEKLT